MSQGSDCRFPVAMVDYGYPGLLREQLRAVGVDQPFPSLRTPDLTDAMVKAQSLAWWRVLRVCLSVTPLVAMFR